MSGSGISPYTQDKKLYLILDALVSSVNYYPVRMLSIYPLIDIFKLLVQQPLVFSFLDDCLNLVYSSMEDPQYVDSFHAILNEITKRSTKIQFTGPSGQIFYLVIHQQSYVDETNNLQFSEAAPDVLKQYRRLFKGIELDHDIGQALYIALRDFNLLARQPIDEGISRAPVLSSKQYGEMVEPVRSVLDAALGELQDSPLLHFAPNSSNKPLPYPNIFFVVRNATVSRRTSQFSFDFTAQILLSNVQRQSIETWCQTVPKGCCSTAKLLHKDCLIVSRLDQVIEQLEQPLGKESRSVSDTVFCSGSIEFSPERARQGRDHGMGAKDHRRQKVEECIYAQIINEQPKALLIPIHIGGVPWVTLYTLTSPDSEFSESSWKHNYHIYRTVTRSIATRLRAGISQLYVNLVAGELERDEHYSHGMLAVDLLNKRWELIAAVYPFNCVEITLEPGCCSHTSYLIQSRHSSTRYCLTLVPNRFYSRQVTYVCINGEDVHSACLRALDRVDEKLDVINKLFSEQVKQQGHTLGNTLHSVTLVVKNLLRDFDGISKALLKEPKQAAAAALPDGAEPDRKRRGSVGREAKLKVVNEFHRRLLMVSGLVDVWSISLQMLLEKNQDPPGLNGANTLEELLDWFDKRIHGKAHLHLVNKLPQKHAVALSDVSGAFTVLWNLINNACNEAINSCIPEIPPPVELMLAQVSDTHVSLGIVNAGEMPDELIEKILNNNAVYPQGIWKGYAVIQRKMNDMGWRIVALNTCGGNTTMDIYIPYR